MLPHFVNFYHISLPKQTKKQKSCYWINAFILHVCAFLQLTISQHEKVQHDTFIATIPAFSLSSFLLWRMPTFTSTTDNFFFLLVADHVLITKHKCDQTDEGNEIEIPRWWSLERLISIAIIHLHLSDFVPYWILHSRHEWRIPTWDLHFLCSREDYHHHIHNSFSCQ